MASSPTRPRRYRHRDLERRERVVKLYLTDGEYAEVSAAAATVEDGPLSVSAYAAGAVLAFAQRALSPELDPLRDAVRAVLQARASVNRFGGNVNQAVAAMHSTGRAPVWLADAVGLCARAVGQADAAMVELRRQLGPLRGGRR